MTPTEFLAKMGEINEYKNKLVQSVNDGNLVEALTFATMAMNCQTFLIAALVDDVFKDTGKYHSLN